MKIIDTSTMNPDALTEWERDQVYNGLDCCVTAEVLEAILPQLDNHTAGTYNFSRELQGPVLEMRCRGILIDQRRRQEIIDDYYEKIEQLERQLERLAFEGGGMMHFNWRSNDDLQTLFYEKLQLPIIKKQGRPTVNRDALEKMEAYLICRQVCMHLMLMRDMQKRLQTIMAEIDSDGRIRTSYNIAGTNTGRFSSSFSEFGTGGNLQNWENYLQSMMISDKGMKFAKFDAKSGESFIVGALEWNLFRDDKYLEACASGDPHTAVARIVYPELPWTQNLKKDKDIAEQPAYRTSSYRFLCKKIGHGTNYGGQPVTIARESKLPVSVISAFQPLYFRAFPAHLQWHAYTRTQLGRHGQIISLMGRKRDFWGRRNDGDTLRAAIAYDPQSSLADIVNRALIRTWRSKIAINMMQDHDALTFQYPEHLEDEIVPKILAMLPETIALSGGREMRIPYDAKTGWNRGDFNEETNPDGLKEWYGGDKRKRSPEVGILDRKLR